MVDEEFGPEVTEQIIALSNLPSGGAYTNVGTYDHSEIVTLVDNLSKVSGLEVTSLVFDFGKYLIKRFQVLFPQYFVDISDVTVLLERVNDYIHVEVRKLYRDAQLPQISTERIAGGGLVLNYRSARGMGGLAQGMIAGSNEIFGSKYTCSRQDLETEEGCQCIRFTMTPKNQQG